MDLLRWEAISYADDTDLDSPPEPPATMTLIPMSIPFLSLPRELRDMIYRHLLCTKYTKGVSETPSMVCTNRVGHAASLTERQGLNASTI